MFIVKASLVRMLFIAAFAFICLVSQSKSAAAQPQQNYQAMLDQADVMNGTFAGEAICVRQRQTCKNEKVVLMAQSVGEVGDILITLDFARGGARVPIARGKLQYDSKAKYFSGRSCHLLCDVLQIGRSLMSTSVAGTQLLILNSDRSRIADETMRFYFDGTCADG